MAAARGVRGVELIRCCGMQVGVVGRRASSMQGDSTGLL